MKKKQYVFLDESGKPEIYSSRGINLIDNGQTSRFLIIAAITTEDQLTIQQQVTNFKLQLLQDNQLSALFSPAYSLDTLHAQKDYREVQYRFYECISQLNIEICAIVTDKLQCSIHMQHQPAKLYALSAGQLLQHLYYQAENTEIIFSRKDSKLKLRQELEREIEYIRLYYLREQIEHTKTFTIQYYHHPHYTHGGLQIADYIAYAIFQLYERNNDTFYKMIKDKTKILHLK